MAFRMGTMALMRVSDHKKFVARLRELIQRHRGVLMRVSQDIDVGYTTLKRWVRDESLTALVAKWRVPTKKRPTKGKPPRRGISGK